MREAVTNPILLALQVSKKSLANEDNPNKPGEGVKIVVSDENNATEKKSKPACCGG